MIKRLISCNSSDLESMSRMDLLQSIAASEGRVLVGETIGTIQPMLGDVTNAEFAAAMGADILLLNIFDVASPVIQGLPEVTPADTIHELRRLTGRPIGINLEPVEDLSAVDTEDLWALTNGRRATPENALIAADMGASMILLTGNPGIGVSNPAIIHSLRALREVLGDRMILAAGKMHSSGILGEAGERILTVGDISEFVEAGADIILMPAPGTVPGVTLDYVRSLINHAHSLGALALTSIGTSQEGADTATIREIALMCKMAGADLHHLGDAGYGGIALPENILAYSIAIRGVRHTYHRMAASVNR